ncbi:MAG: MoaD/ThiS family protein [Armatimonadetes bacterium]|nr:MoaD/ThiS family protein [Armatimonadota bacterium]
MTVTLRMFAQLREALGASQTELTLPENATGLDVWAWVRSSAPSLQLPREVCRLAVNCEFVSFDKILSDGDEVAILTPVAGG